MNDQCKSELERANNMAEVFAIVQKYYDLNTAQLTFVTRLTVISGIKTAIKLTGAQEK
jgi:hypothetical protein